ncbi:universal stress protein [Streptomyces sp. NPDC049879]|uniref:universal stress protein n=1 Tax=Streptomyces sp. NPDC049879 TaxID=3365598 RepID=UPI0037B7ABD3
MVSTVVAGLDGSAESLAAAEWAAREAELRGLPLRLVHAREPVPEFMVQAPPARAETHHAWSERIAREAADRLRLRHPGVDVTVEQLDGLPHEVLSGAARDSALVVLGSRGLSGIGGFLLGSVGQAVVARSEQPVVLVRAGQQASAAHTGSPAGTPFRPVVLGLDTGSPHDTVIGFAFDAALRRETGLTVVHGWNPPPSYAYALAADPGLLDELSKERAETLAEVLRPWRRRFPAVEVTERSRNGSVADHLVDASREASLLVVGRRVRRSPFGVHIGPVTHSVLHHATAPVAVVAHD